MTSTAGDTGATPITIALVNDYRVVVEQLREMLAPFASRVSVVDMEVGTDVVAPADVALFDTLGGQRHALSRAHALVARHGVDHVIIYARDPSPEFVRAAQAMGVDDVIDKTTTGEELVEAIEVVAGHRAPAAKRSPGRPRRAEGELTLRDREFLALLAMGLSNEQIADESFIGVETVRTHLQHLFQRLGVRNRSQAALHAASFGLTPVRSTSADDHAAGRRHSRQFRRVPQDVGAARSFVADVLRRVGATDHEIDVCRLAVSELASNVVMHGERSGWTVGIKATREWCTLDVTGGQPGDDNPVLHPDQWTIADADRASGRGLGIVRRVMDEVVVERWRGRVRVVCRLRRGDT